MSVNDTESPSVFQECPITLQFDTRNISRFPKSAISTWTTLSAINGITTLPIFYINLMVIWTILEKESLRSSIYNQMLVILSVFYLLTGIVVIPLFITFNCCIILGCSSVCELSVSYVVLAVLCTGWSSVTLMMISVERCLYIEHPLYYATKITSKKVLTATGIAWIVFLLTIVLGRLATGDSKRVSEIPGPLAYGVSIIITVFCLAKVTKTTIQQRRSINAQQAAFQGSKAHKIKEYKRTIALVAILVASVMFYCPIFVVKIIRIQKRDEWIRNNDLFIYITNHIFVTFLHFQSLVNPLIFSLRLSYIRNPVMKKLFCR